MRTLRLTVFAAAVLSCLLRPKTAAAGEFQMDGQTMLRASTWRGDYGVAGQLRLGYRIYRSVAFDVAAYEEYATVDQRIDTGLTLGVTGFLPFESFRPLLRGFFIHQHEEAIVSIKDHPWGTVFGIGTGIRHRAGGGVSLGAEIPLMKKNRIELYAVVTGTSVILSEDILGPAAYFGLTGGIGFNYDLAGQP